MRPTKLSFAAVSQLKFSLSTCASTTYVADMSKVVSDGGAATTAAPAGMPFEEALKKLEAIVEAMESDELPLEQLLARFEEGSKLAQVCQARLAEAELKVQQLEKNATGELTLKPAALSDTAPEE
jgi:exodeoxyribonuclease VII small subunit